MRTLMLLAAAALAAAPLHAQDEEFTRPPEWRLRFDRTGTPDTAVYFVEMPPGWHVTTGPAVILWDPARTASGDYMVRSTIHLFDPGQRREAFGLFIGGRDLSGPEQAYTYFLIRRNGSFLVKERRGDDTQTLVEWTEHEAIVPHPGGDQTVENTLEIRCAGDGVAFLVNGETVTTLPRSRVMTDGVVGLRVNHALNVHVEELVVERS
ncbi:MAG: hypothetical protein PVF27_00615 [Gemmatimonadales bacterium]|jgi:hypothetical protein